MQFRNRSTVKRRSPNSWFSENGLRVRCQWPPAQFCHVANPKYRSKTDSPLITNNTWKKERDMRLLSALVLLAAVVGVLRSVDATVLQQTQTMVETAENKTVDASESVNLRAATSATSQLCVAATKCPSGYRQLSNCLYYYSKGKSLRLSPPPPTDKTMPILCGKPCWNWYAKPDYSVEAGCFWSYASCGRRIVISPSIPAVKCEDVTKETVCERKVKKCRHGFKDYIAKDGKCVWSKCQCSKKTKKCNKKPGPFFKQIIQRKGRCVWSKCTLYHKV